VRRTPGAVMAASTREVGGRACSESPLAKLRGTSPCQPRARLGTTRALARDLQFPARTRRNMHSRKTLLIHGVLAGALGAGCMTVLRMFAHRAGWIQAMVPQAVEVWAKDTSALGRPRTLATHHVADQLLHLGYGAFWGGVYAAALGPRNGVHAAALGARNTASPFRALELGASLWALGSMLLFPALKIAPPVWRSEPRAELVNISAHALYGAVTVYLVEELERQRYTQPRAHGLMRHARVG